MRIAVHAGYLQADATGWAGNAINTASRLLDAPVLRRALSVGERAQTALIVSDDVYRAVIVQGHTGLDPATFHSVLVAVKELDTTAWIHVPGYADLPGAPPDPKDRSGSGDGPPPLGEPVPAGEATPYTSADAGSVVINAGGPVAGGIAGRDIAGGDIVTSERTSR
jgi:hypothetical protein